ncbi:MAG: radical SAM protein [Bacteroidales bacterium]|nr:radical SAM protein [Bacteroidales bacterium]
MKINEIFYSLQGEGYHTGTAATFIRFSGCNLSCPFCDTHHESSTEMTEDEVIAKVAKYPATLIVVTGGEPAMQLTSSLIDALHGIGRKVAVETNGTMPLPDNVDWITLSPKDAFLGSEATPVLTYADELKVVYDGEHTPPNYDYIKTKHRFLQPCDTGNPTHNAAIVQSTIEYIKKDPRWRLSLQTHKILNIR